MIRENVLAIKRQVGFIASKINRDPEQITIVAVSKGRSIEEIKEAIKAGISDIGENRIQEAVVKYNTLKMRRPEFGNISWHFVGHLQTNKVKEAVRIFDLIQSVDSQRLAAEINKQAAHIGKIQDILIEVKTSPEATKFGFMPEEVIAAIKEMNKLKNINIKGLMTIAPRVDEPEKARPYFRLLRELKDNITKALIPLTQPLILSMGMSDDFPIAIEEGADMLRLGRAIFS
ncbi:MAG: YggS family pyridoxal phosphate-dependent enzyme [Candidatus Omnitrophica bacterium]|nr:YggS family pyridoxal phosphate-dependent enzyme [Candidatus Omnitrophota bacterium]